MKITNLKEFRNEMLKAGYTCEMHGAVYEFRSGNNAEYLEAELKQRTYKRLGFTDFFRKGETPWGEDRWERISMNELVKEFL